MLLAQRIVKKFQENGEQFIVNGNTCRGVFRLLDLGTMRVYLDDVEVLGVIRPGLMLITTPDAQINVNDTITRDGRTYTVLKISLHRIGDTSVVKTAVMG